MQNNAEIKFYHDKVTIPLSPQLMKDFFENKEQHFIVDYKNCSLKGGVFLTYLSNLNIKVLIDLEGVSSVEKKELLISYMSTRHIVSSETLTMLALDLLCFFKTGQSLLENTPIAINELEELTKENTELLANWTLFLDSSILFLASTVDELSQKMELKTKYEVVDDQRFIGLNVVNMYSLPAFYEVYFTLPLGEMKYFLRQFEEYMFNGKNLFHYFNSKENLFLGLLIGLLDEKVSLEQLV